MQVSFEKSLVQLHRVVVVGVVFIVAGCSSVSQRESAPSRASVIVPPELATACPITQSAIESLVVKTSGLAYNGARFGNVGTYTARLLSQKGAVIVGVGDAGGYIANSEGINPHKLSEHVAKTRTVAGYRGAAKITREEFFGLEADIFVPAALELELGLKEAKALKAKVVVEGANGPTYPEAEEYLIEKGVDIIPDILCNSGGVIVSYYEWLQNKRSEQWELADVMGRLERRMKQTYANVRQHATAQKTDWRAASYAIGLERLQHCYKERGIFP